MPILTIATCQHPGAFSQESDDALLQAALSREGISSTLVAWDDPTYDWLLPDLVLIRSTWDYPADPTRFLAWADDVTRLSTLWNPVQLVRWNAHKTYLLDLHTQGVPIIPTVWLPAHSPIRLAPLMRSHGWGQVVVKPVVATSARGAKVVSSSTFEAGQAHLSALLSREAVMVQPFLPSFYSVGEHALIFIQGVFTHAIRKRFSLIEGLDQTGLQDIEVGEEERVFARQVLHHLPRIPLVARVDLVRDHRHHLVLNELEVIEPVLYLSRSPQALHQLTQVCCQPVRQAEQLRSPMEQQATQTGLRAIPLSTHVASLRQAGTAPTGHSKPASTRV